MLAEEDQCHTIERMENDARTQLDIAQNIMMRILDESREDQFILQGCAERFIGHRAVAGDSSLTEKNECVMPPAAEPSCKRTSVMISACGSLQWLFSKVRLEYLGCRYKVVADRSHSNRCT